MIRYRQAEKLEEGTDSQRWSLIFEDAAQRGKLN